MHEDNLKALVGCWRTDRDNGNDSFFPPLLLYLILILVGRKDAESLKLASSLSLHLSVTPILVALATSYPFPVTSLSPYYNQILVSQ